MQRLLKKLRTVERPHTTYQPSMADVWEEFDMPAASPERIRRAFFRPVVERRK